MGTVTIGNRSFVTPILVPSVSSFETQLRPFDALLLQHTLREPISLVSAYDVWLDRENLIPLSKVFRKHGVLLLDSGGYESSRISHYAPEHREQRWDFTKYSQVASEDIYDFIFSFDYFLETNESSVEFSARMLSELEKHGDVLDLAKLIPVIHVRTIDGRRGLNDEAIVRLFRTIASQIKCRFIAIPERELGFGITSRATIARKIAAALHESSSTECSLHILGCGNLLSFSLFAVAGALMCDGLEWCRTLAADHFHLHHFQHKDVFADPGYYAENPVAEFLVSDGQLDYPTSVAVRNLLSFQVFTRMLHQHLSAGSVHKLVSQHFGSVAGEAVLPFEA